MLFVYHFLNDIDVLQGGNIMFYSFGRYKLDTCSHELLHQGEGVKIKPLIYKLLIYMLENSNRVLSRNELIQHVWKARIISDSAISAAISTARHAIGDSGKQQKLIKTVSGHGYRFVAPLTRHAATEVDITSSNIKTPTCDSVEVLQQSPSLIINKASQDQKYQQLVKSVTKKTVPLSLPDQPSIAVMDFIALKNGPMQHLSAYGLTIEINAGLARLSQLFVIARASSAHLFQMNLSPTQIGQRLGVRYLLYGHTKVVNRRIEVMLTLVDTSTCAEIWSEHFRFVQDDIPSVQNDMIAEIVAVVNGTIERAEIKRSFLIPTENLSAWEHYYRGLWHMHQTCIENCNTAHYHFQQALAQDARFSRAYAGLSFTYSSRVLLDYRAAVNSSELKKAKNSALQGIAYDRNDPSTFFSLGRSFWLSGNHEQCITECNQGLSLATQDILGLGVKSMSATLACHDKQAHESLQLAYRISPFNPMMFAMNSIYALSLVHQQKYDRAVILSLRAINDPNAYYLTYATASICHELAGYSARAKGYAREVLKRYPKFTITTYQRLLRHTDKATCERIAEAMHKAGLP